MPTDEEELKAGKRYPAASGEKPKKGPKKNPGSAKKASEEPVKKGAKKPGES
jgi:hypothetical protein